MQRRTDGRSLLSFVQELIRLGQTTNQNRINERAEEQFEHPTLFELHAGLALGKGTGHKHKEFEKHRTFEKQLYKWKMKNGSQGLEEKYG